jgi:hypothetical protein
MHAPLECILQASSPTHQAISVCRLVPAGLLHARACCGLVGVRDVTLPCFRRAFAVHAVCIRIHEALSSCVGDIHVQTATEVGLLTAQPPPPPSLVASFMRQWQLLRTQLLTFSAVRSQVSDYAVPFCWVYPWRCVRAPCCVPAGIPSEDTAKKHLSGWVYITFQFFRSWARCRALFPFLSPSEAWDSTDCNNLVESFHAVLKHRSDGQVRDAGVPAFCSGCLNKLSLSSVCWCSRLC